jgi:RHS repeat-associated protein
MSGFRFGGQKFMGHRKENYDGLVQVTAGRRYWGDQTPVAGQQFDYAFDDIGNRTQTKAGGDASGGNLRVANYSANSLNQYISRDVPGAVDVMGLELATNTVTVNGLSTYRKGEYFRKEIMVDNHAGPVWQSVTNSAPNETTIIGSVFVPKTQEQFVHDADGNLLSDGRWNYTWDAENRLVQMVANTSVGPQQMLKFEYDSKGRRIRKQVWSNTSGSGDPVTDVRFLYDGWNLIATLNSQLSTLNTFTWGLDLSGSLEGAGGIGGLLQVAYNGNQTTNCFVAFDGNGNVAGLCNAADGTSCAQYDYAPFGEVLRATGPMAKFNPIRYSAKYQDDETDLLYNGYRFYNGSVGRWLGRDPSLEIQGGCNLYAIVHNDTPNRCDYLGLWDSDDHHEIVVDWLSDKLGSSYRKYRWHGCCVIDVASWIAAGSDNVDGNLANGMPWLGFCDAQRSANSYQHAMRNGAANESVQAAAAKYGEFISDNTRQAIIYSDKARDEHLYGCENIGLALFYLGRAFHAYSDSTSPAHKGFQAWWGPIDGAYEFGPWGYLAFVLVHAERENSATFQHNENDIKGRVAHRFNALLEYILKE